MLVDCNSLSEVRAARAQKSQNSHQNGTANCLDSHYGGQSVQLRSLSRRAVLAGRAGSEEDIPKLQNKLRSS